MSQPCEFVAGGAVAQFRLVAEGEQRLLAARRLAGSRDRKHRVARQIGRLFAPWCASESTVVADVATQLGERDEYLAGVRDDRAMGQIAPARGYAHELMQVIAVR